MSLLAALALMRHDHHDHHDHRKTPEEEWGERVDKILLGYEQHIQAEEERTYKPVKKRLANGVYGRKRLPR